MPHIEGMRIESHFNASSSWLLSAAEAAKLLNISQRHLWALSTSGRMPAPIRLGRSVRWSADELRTWLDAGCPTRDRWENAKGGAS